MTEPAPTAVVAKKPKGRVHRAAQVTTFRTVLNPPYSIKWPVLDTSIQQQLMEKIEIFVKKVYSLSSDLKRKTKTQTQTKATNEQSKQEKEKQQSQEKIKNMEPIQKLKKQCPRFIFGINEITKKLERKELEIVIVIREADQPSLLIEHIYWLCVSNAVPVCVVQNTDEFFVKLFKTKSTLAFGFKKNDDSVVVEKNKKEESTKKETETEATTKTTIIQNGLNELLSFLHATAKPLSRPWILREEVPVFYETQLVQHKRKRDENNDTKMEENDETNEQKEKQKPKQSETSQQHQEKKQKSTTTTIPNKTSNKIN